MLDPGQNRKKKSEEILLLLQRHRQRVISLAAESICIILIRVSIFVSFVGVVEMKAFILMFLALLALVGMWGQIQGQKGF